MEAKKAFFLVFLTAAFFAHAQSRDDIQVYLPMPLGGNAMQQQFFHEQFTAEVEAASYIVTDNEKSADYAIRLEIKSNMILYEDENGNLVEEAAQPGGEDPLYVVELKLFNNATGEEMVSFEYPFTDVEEMYEWNLYLIYQAMANVPLTKFTGLVDDDRWRNKWLYVRTSFFFSLQVYQVAAERDGKLNQEYRFTYDQNGQPLGQSWQPPDRDWRELLFTPGGTLGLEFQFLNFMSAEGDIKFIFGDPDDTSFIPTIGAYLKFILKPSKHFMLEPYLGVDFPMFMGKSIQKERPFMGIAGGFQFGVKGGSMGAFFVDIGGSYNFGDMRTETAHRRAWWSRWLVEFGLGYKFGFFDRVPQPAK